MTVFAGRSSLPDSGGTSFATSGLRGGAAGSRSKQSAASRSSDTTAQLEEASVDDVQRLEGRKSRKSFVTAEDVDRALVESDEPAQEQWAAARNREREAEQWEHGHVLGLEGSSERHASCPLIYTVDAKTARKHGLVLFQV